MSQGTANSRRHRGLFIGHLLGIEFYLDYSWFLIAAIVTYTLAADWFPQIEPGYARSFYLAMGASGAVLFFFSIILHELGHSVVSQRCGIAVPSITLLFVGGLAEISREPDDAKSELKIALAGPAVSIVLSILYKMLAWLFIWLSWMPAAAVCQWLAATNLGLVIFNMIPGYPLDGGRVLRALLWAHTGRLRRSTYITSRIGIGFSWLLVACGVFLLSQHEWYAIVLVLIAFFLKGAAESGYTAALHREALAGVRVRDIMTRNPVFLPATLPLNIAVDDFFLANHYVAFPVCADDGEFRGLLRLDFLRKVPREKWPYTTVGDLVAETGAQEFQVSSDESAARAMRRLLPPGHGQMAVVEDGVLVGILTRHDVLRVIEIHTVLEE